MGAILDAALEYAQAGYAVIPVTRADKRPYIAGGSHSASTDPDVIRKWWKQYPNANVAIVCGAVSGNLFAIDVDVKDGKKGDESLEVWQSKHGLLPYTVVQTTGSGGKHYFFRSPVIAQYDSKVDALPGVDIRGEWTYVVVWPSVYEVGRMYHWDREISVLDTEEVAEANGSVYDLLDLNKKSAKTAKKSDPSKKVKLADVKEGGRNEAIFKYAASQCGMAVPIEYALQIALQMNASWSDPLPENEVRKTVNSAYRYEPNENNLFSGTSKAEPDPDPDELDISTLDDIEEREVEWLIPGYLPKDQITLICGTGGTGKTSIWTALAADLSAGRPTIFEKGSDFCDQIQRDPMKILFFSAEDTVENVIKKRLRLQKAVMRNIYTISVSNANFDKVRFGTKYLEALIRKKRPQLCIFDPLQAFIDGKTKMADRNAMRQTMRCLIEWGSKYGTTFLIVMHTNKQLNAWGRTRMADSADLWDIARCVWMVGDTEEDGIKYLSHEKNNYGRTNDTVLFRNDNGIPTYWMRSKQKDRDFVMAAAKIRNSQNKSSDVEEVEEFIMSALVEYSEGLFTKELDSLLDSAGYKRWAINKAKSQLKDKKKIRYTRTGMTDPWKIKKV